ncbi:MAG: DNA mismatch repair protein [Chitinophagaceae bacterium]|nr:DNA mismatch repair protein [Chitinophagaceae bacterium]
MRFTTDQQTLDDLRLFGKGGDGSIYQLFNRTATRGGAAILEEWFRYPLSDEKLINERSGIIRHFAQSGQPFPFRPELFDQIEQYLADHDERSRLTGREQSLKDKMSGLIAEDSEYKTIHQGVAALVEMAHGLKALFGGDGFGAYRSEAAALAELLNEPVFMQLLELPVRGKLSYEKVAVHDAHLRFRHRDSVRRLLGKIYHLDVYISVAAVARQRGFAFAEALPRDRQMLRSEGLYHPSVPNAVPNNLAITTGSNIIFLTGANMAGKSTFMKSLGIALFLAHMGLPVPASSMVFSVRDAIYTTINLSDNLGAGASHFYAEVLRVKKVARELSLGKSLFVIFDELFRGTNVKDAYEATVALTSAFAGHKDSIFVISTHIIEAGDVLKERHDNIHFVFLPTRMQGDRPVYTYTLEKGITADRHGMIIINNEGILEKLKNGKPKITKHNLV